MVSFSWPAVGSASAAAALATGFHSLRSRVLFFSRFSAGGAAVAAATLFSFCTGVEAAVGFWGRTVDRRLASLEAGGWGVVGLGRTVCCSMACRQFWLSSSQRKTRLFRDGGRTVTVVNSEKAVSLLSGMAGGK